MSAAFRITQASEAELELLWQHGCQGILEEVGSVTAYFAKATELPLNGTWETVDGTDYVAQYYANLKPIHLHKLVIAPTHREVTLTAGQKPLWLDPGMAFGSGHHETTRMALEALESVELLDKTVLDVGAGSGILAIAASLLGAAAQGVDNDPLTLDVAEANARLNHVTPSFKLGTLEANPEALKDVLVANLFAELHVLLAPLYAEHLKVAGKLIVTGILSEKLDGVIAALKPNFDDINVVTDAEWALVSARRK